MTDMSSAALALRPGKHNMASDAFEQLRAARRDNTKAPEGGQLTFNDLLDTLNPLQHIPVISDIYRELTGDSISEQARVMGGTLYGGPIGLISSVATAAIAAANDGKDLGQQAIAAVFGPDEETPSENSKLASIPTEIASPASPDALVRESLAQHETTASIAPKSSKALPGDKPVPEMSPEAFNALMNAFEKKPAATPKPSAMAEPKPATPLALQPNAAASTQTPADLMAKMQEALDKYQALKSGAMSTASASF